MRYALTTYAAAIALLLGAACSTEEHRPSPGPATRQPTGQQTAAAAAPTTAAPPVPAPCATDADVVARFEAATGDDLGPQPCVFRSERFARLLRVASRVADRGCVQARWFADCNFERALDARAILQQAGWPGASASEREELALAYIVEVDNRDFGRVMSAGQDESPHFTHDSRGTMTIDVTIRPDQGAPAQRSFSRFRYSFSAAGDVRVRELRH